MKIIFFGSDDFALAHLQYLFDKKFDIVACVAPPDRAKDRGMKIQYSPIKQFALDHDIKLFQPENVRALDFLESLKQINADLFVVIAYGKILPLEVLNIPKICAINVHGSLLPKYRGAAPINWVILNGEKQTGVTIIKMNEKMDAGKVLGQSKLDIEKSDTSVTLRLKMMDLGKSLLVSVLEKIKLYQDSFGILQDQANVTFASKLTKELGLIDWNNSAENIFNQVRGLLPWPKAYTFYNGKRLSVIESEIVKQNELNLNEVKPGRVDAVGKNGITVMTGDGGILLKKVILEGAKPVDAFDFTLGHKVEAGFLFRT